MAGMILRDSAHGLGRLNSRNPGDTEGPLMTLQIKAGRSIGQILVDGGFLSFSDIELALEEQKNTNELLGRVLTRMGVLEPADLQAALSVQEHLVRLEDAVKTAAGVRKALGALLLQAGSISEEQLEQALAEQRKSGEKLGEVFVRLGFLTERQLDALLEFQQGQESGSPADGPLRLGDILVSSGHISRDQLDHALRKQRTTRKKLGEVLIEEGYARPQQVSHGIQLQQKLLTAVLVAILSLASLPDAEAETARAASAQLKVSATVLPYTTMNVQNRAQMLTVTDADVSRGYVDIVGGSSIEVKSNSRGGYYLSFECFDPAFRQVRIDGLGKSATIGAGSGIVPMAMDGRVVRIDLSYRFILSENVRPGAYPWPLTVSVMPM
jgi:mannitol/fructose-specific phosphotransferase system IIA component (Ntr-type)